MNFVEKSFPVEQYETYRDDDGKLKSRKVYDSSGNPVLNREAIRQREMLLDKLGSIPMPSSPLNMIIDHFGTDMVAENTGRSRRVVTKDDGKRVVESITQAKKNADVDDFQSGKKRIIVFSEAGGTGKSYHADNSAKNKQQRIHYVLEAGWKADSAVQGFGRSHRSNQAVTPEFKLVTTDLKGQNRFISTIAKRLNQLGALTKGQRQAGSQGLFNSSDSLEGSLAVDTLANFYKALSRNAVDGVGGMQVIKKMGLANKILNEYGNFNDNAAEARDISKFLNRILILGVDEQNTVFDRFAEALQVQTDIAEQNGTLDKGLENYKADSVHLDDTQEVRTDNLTGAKTLYYSLTSEHKIKPRLFEDINTGYDSFEGFFVNKKTNAVRAAFKTSSSTDSYGNITQRYRLEGQTGKEYLPEKNLKLNWEKVERDKAEGLWNEAVSELPETEKRSLNLIGGAVLPVWDKLPSDNTRIVRVLTDTGDVLIGRVIPEKALDQTLRRIGAVRKTADTDVSELVSGIKSGKTLHLDNGWRISKRKVSNENRIEISGPTMTDSDILKNKGVFTERIGYTTRYFIPYSAGAEDILRKVLDDYPLSYTENTDNSYSKAVSGSPIEERWQTELDTETDDNKGKYKEKLNSVDDVRKYLSKALNIPISTGKVYGNNEGVFKNSSEVIRTKITDDLPTIAHEVGHYFNKKYNLQDSEYISEAMSKADKKLLDMYKDEEKPGEAVAEFVRQYMKNRSAARVDMPNFYDDFINTIDKPDLDILNTAAKRINEYMSSDFGARVSSSIVTNKEASQTSVKNKVSTFQREILNELVDGFLPIKNATEFVKKTSGALDGEKDAYILASNSRNASSVTDYILKHGMTDLDGNIDIGQSFIDCIKNVKGKDLNKFSEYLVLKHSLEWIEPNEGGTVKRVFADDTLENADSIREEINMLETTYPEFKEAAENLYEYQRNLVINFGVQAGGIDSETANKLFELYPCYVPFFRSNNTVKGQKGTFANQKAPIMRAKGSGAAILNPLESIVKNTDRFVKFAMRRRVCDVLCNYADTVDGFGQFIERVPPDVRVTKIKMGDYIKKIEETLDGNISPDAMFAIDDALNNILGDEISGYTPIADAKNKIIFTVRNGKAEYYQVHNDELFSAIAEMTPQQLGRFFKVSQAIMKPMKMLITSLNPVFATSNPIRDFDTAYKNSVINNPAEFIGNYAKAVKDIITKSDDYKQYLASGGGHSSLLSAQIDIIQKDLKKIAQKDMGIARRVFKAMINPIHIMSELNDITETIPRLAEFNAVKKRGGDNAEAMYAADDITVNFKRNGAGGRKLNAMFMFNNASIQGISKLYRSFKDATPKERLSRTAKYVTQAVLTTLLISLLNRRDKESEEAYDNLSQYTKNSYYVFYLGDGKFLKIPKAREMAVLNSFAERVVDKLMDDDKAFYQFGNYLADNILPPMIPRGKTPTDMLHSTLNNTVLGGVADIGFNKDYKGTPIESKKYEYLPRTQRYNDRTSKTAIALSNTWFGEYTNMSPLQIDHIISSYGGYIGQLNNSLFANGENSKDFSFGFKNKYVADSLYSEDKTDIVYENRDKTKSEYENTPTIDNAVKYEKAAMKSGFISEMTAAVSSLPADKQRDGKAKLLKALDTWNDNITETDKRIMKRLDGYTGRDNGFYLMSEMPDSKLERTKDGVKQVYQMTPDEYTEYAKAVLKEVEKAKNLALQNSSLSQDETAARLKTAVSNAKKSIKKQYVDRYSSRLK